MSTLDQDAALQLDAPNAAACYRVFVDTMSGALERHAELDKLLDLTPCQASTQPKTRRKA